MAHVYASLAQLNNTLRDNGSVTFATESATISDRKMEILRAVSREVDAHCERSDFGSGFGPRTGTNRYDGDGTAILRLRDDLLSLTTLTVYDGTGGTGTVYVVETDVYLEPYDRTPRRRIVAHGQGSLSAFTRGYRTVDALGSWGERDQRRTATATASAIASTTATSVTVSDGAEFSPGITILIDTEQLYVSAVSGTTLTVERGANGTTAATHGAAAAIQIYEYHPGVVSATLQLSLRRWKARDAGSDGTDGGGDVPTVRPQSESSILRATVGRLRLPSVR